MNNFLNKILFSVLSVLLVGALTGCNPEEDNTISAKIQAVGPEYVDVYVAGPNIVHLAYIVRAEEAAVPPTPQVLFNTGTEKSVKGGSTMRIVGGLKPNTQYFIYLAAKIDGMNFYEVCLPFTTAVYQDNGELLSVVSNVAIGIGTTHGFGVVMLNGRLMKLSAKLSILNLV